MSGATANTGNSPETEGRGAAAAAMYDAAVVGLGAMGSAALFHLARRGVRAVGLERFAPGHDRGSSHGESRIIRLSYFEHPSYVPLLRRAYENWRDLERLTGESLLTRTGILEAGRPGSGVVAGTLAASRLHDLPHEALTAAEANRRFPALALTADWSAVFQPDGGLLRPERAVLAHVSAARAAGAEVRTSARVVAVEPTPGGVRLRVEGQEPVPAARVVVAAGPWIADLLPDLAPHLRLTRQVLGWFAPRDADALRLGRFPVAILDDGPAGAVYGFPDLGTGTKWARHGEAGVLAHADRAAQDAGPGDEAALRGPLDRLVPGAAGPLLRMRTCIYTRTADEHFVLDAPPGEPRLIAASPCSGHGFKFASVLGEALAEWAVEGGTRFDLSRFTMARLHAAAA